MNTLETTSPVPSNSPQNFEVLLCLARYGREVASFFYPDEIAGVPWDDVVKYQHQRDELHTPELALQIHTLEKKIFDRVSLKAVAAILEKKGLPLPIWKFLNSHVHFLKQSLVAGVHLEQLGVELFVSAAAEAGYHSLALELGVADPFYRAHSALYCGKAPIVEEAIRQLDAIISRETVDSEMVKESLLKRAALDMFIQRREGSFQVAIEIFESRILPLIFNIAGHTAAIDIADLGDIQVGSLLASDILLIAGSSMFNASRYSSALGLYEKSFNIYESLDRPEKSAIAAYNSAVAASYLDLDGDVTKWLGESRARLNRFQLPGLEWTHVLFEIDRHVLNGEFAEAIRHSTSILNIPELSDVQKILLHQHRARAFTEQGQVSEAEIALALSRQGITQSKFYQYETFQLALETDLENLTYRRIAKSSYYNNPKRAEDRRALTEYKIALVRKGILTGEKQKVQKLFREIQLETPNSIRSRCYIRDLEIEYSPETYQAEVRPRAIERVLLRAIESRDSARVGFVIQNLKSSNPNAKGAWWKALLSLAQAFEALLKQDKVAGRVYAEEALSICEACGLERLLTISLGASAFCDNHRQANWLQHLTQLSERERQTLRAFFRSAVGEDVAGTVWVVDPYKKELSPRETEHIEQCELLIHQGRGEVRYQGKTVPVSGQSVLFNVLVQIALSQRQGLGKAELMQKVWGLRYDPVVHDPVVYSSIARLRESMPIELHQGRYRLPTNIHWKMIADSEIGVHDSLNDRQLSIMSILQSGQRARISRREVVTAIHVSPRTALRELTELVDKKILTREGAGRAAVYMLPPKGARL